MAFDAALTGFIREYGQWNNQALPAVKNESGKETVKFLILYQALTKVEPRGGKEKGSDKVFCLVAKFPTLSHSRQLLARAARTFHFPLLSLPISALRPLPTAN